MADTVAAGWTPCVEHLGLEAWQCVYEPSEDTFLLLDALHGDASLLRSARLVVEIGPGSGTVTTFVSRLINRAAMHLAVDVNRAACDATTSTAIANGVGARVEVVQGDLLSGLRLRGKVDALIFNPPYVPTDSTEVASDGIEAAWAGGLRGREVVDRLLPHVSEWLADCGAFYLVVVDENDPREIMAALAKQSLRAEIVASKRARNEKLSVIRATKGPAPS
ncbi:methylase [Pelagophyceae sp. CCMP2097]|nr:methylase [Pelagophyceae sp. CCMP2097]